MNTWTSGYVADVEYTYGYYHEMNPLHARLALLNMGIPCPEIKTACELGFGQGVSVNFHAAATGCAWYGTDFNPAQTSFASELARVSGAEVSLSDSAFAEYCNDDSIPQLDYICLHGIWSWISDENRKIIVEFAKKKLKVGGVFYISYNTLPGWANFAPMRHLMTQHSSIVGSEDAGIVSRIDGAIGFAQALLKTDPMYSKANPQVIERMSHLKNQNRHYLAHEYFNKDWDPMYYANVAERLESAKLAFACSAHFMEQIDSVNLSKEQAELLSTITNPNLSQSVRDFLVNQQFRRDYWVKGKRLLTPLERIEGLQKIRVILAKPREDIKLKIDGLRGEAVLDEKIYNPILDILSDYELHTIKDLQSRLAGTEVNFNHLIQAILVLANDGTVIPANDDQAIEQSYPRTRKLNTYLMERARSSSNINFLVSPITATGVPANRIQQLFLLAMEGGVTDLSKIVNFAWETLQLQGQALIKEGKTLETPEENIKELSSQAEEFAKKHLPIFKAFKIV